MHNVAITDHQAAFIQQMVDSGQFQNADEVLFESIRLMETIQNNPETKLAALRAAVQQGIDSIEAGNFTEFESADAWADDFRAEAAKLIVQAQAGANA
jgi:antitoxin ParD1/3/4